MTTIEILRQAVAGEIENRFLADDCKECTREVTAIGRFKVLCIDQNFEEVSVPFDIACDLWSHVPTPQPEVLPVGNSYQVLLFPDGTLRPMIRAHQNAPWVDDTAIAAMQYAYVVASLHSSLKALEQEREQEKKELQEYRDIRQFANTSCIESERLRRYHFGNTAMVLERLAALSPYPREEQPR